MALTDAGYVVSRKHPIIRTDALDTATKFIKCHAAVVTVAGLVQRRDDEYYAWTAVFPSLNIAQNLCSDIRIAAFPIPYGLRPCISTCWTTAVSTPDLYSYLYRSTASSFSLLK